MGRKRKTMMEKWKKIQQESENVVITHEVDRYLLDQLESIDDEFDILGWWRINKLKYPTLASIAKDVLAIPTSIIASESYFSTSGRVIDSFRSSLSPKMVEALICSQIWIRFEDISSLQYVPRIEEMEFYKSIEMEIGSKSSITNLKKTLPFQCDEDMLEGCFVKAFGRMDAAAFLEGNDLKEKKKLICA
ncbi:hypothetical protein Prudu_009216 [Prunus dulcis]|uniref:HAT C-terminal dimerisation domain-containing protein n=1 Tax=Prunus dulcis TaxID=3755 RepID=A0A4Y1R630_PRUDU|nr:hypothetical protein Prudu_009216 [Prunus dulcis]